jgi:hypothetical protein
MACSMRAAAAASFESHSARSSCLSVMPGGDLRTSSCYYGFGVQNVAVVGDCTLQRVAGC